MLRRCVLFIIFTQGLSGVLLYHSPSGNGNNIANNLWGSRGSKLLRQVPRSSDVVGNPVGIDRPSARAISQHVFASNNQLKPIENTDFSDYVTYWGQLVSSDILSISSNTSDRMDIKVPLCDEHLDRRCTGNEIIEFARAQVNLSINNPTDPRPIVNDASSFIDAGPVYGDSVDLIRTGYGGKILGLMDTNMTNSSSRHCLNPGTQSLLSVLIREHNRKATELHQNNPSKNDETLYLEARKWVIAIVQKITYNEYLPRIVGESLPSYKGYNDDINPGADAFFMAAAFRFGHSTINPVLYRINKDGEEIEEGHILFRHGIENTVFHIHQAGIEPILRGMATQVQQSPDTTFIDELRMFFLNIFDLAAVNIQRGRDVGLPSYNEARAFFNLSTASTFSDINPNPSKARALELAYKGNISLVDAWVGGLSEPRVPGGSVGALFKASITEQFIRLRDADRFWYERPGYISETDRKILDTVTLKWLIETNTNVKFEKSPFRKQRFLPETSNAFEKLQNIVFNYQMMHGLMMFGTFSLLMPAGIFIARYRESSSWLKLHMKIMVTVVANVLVVAFIGIISSEGFTSNIHSPLGIAIGGGVLLQGSLGFISIQSKWLTKTMVIRRIHSVFGYTLVGLGLLNCWYGIGLLLGQGTFEFNIIQAFFFSSLGFILLVMVGLVPGYPLDRLRKSTSLIKRERKTETRANIELTWSDIIFRVESGNHFYLVVGNRIIDVKKFQSAHPGGRAILHRFIGTDASKYFKGQRDNVIKSVHRHGKFAEAMMTDYTIGHLPAYEECVNMSERNMEKTNVSKYIHLPDNRYIPVNLVKKELAHVSIVTEKPAIYFTFAYPDASLKIQFRPTESITLLAIIDDEIVYRPYTPVMLTSKGEITFCIRIVPGGKMTKHLNEMNIGDHMLVKGPQQIELPSLNYHSPTQTWKQLGMIAFGTGVVPMIHLIRHHINRDSGQNKMVLIYYDSSQDTILCRKELEELSIAAKGTLKVIYGISHANSGNELVGTKLRAEDIQNHMFPPPNVDSYDLWGSLLTLHQRQLRRNSFRHQGGGTKDMPHSSITKLKSSDDKDDSRIILSGPLIAVSAVSEMLVNLKYPPSMIVNLDE